MILDKIKLREIFDIIFSREKLENKLLYKISISQSSDVIDLITALPVVLFNILFIFIFIFSLFLFFIEL